MKQVLRWKAKNGGYEANVKVYIYIDAYVYVYQSKSEFESLRSIVLTDECEYAKR